MSENELVFHRPAVAWTDATPVGCGCTGAMIFGRPREERIALNADTVWSGGPAYSEVPSNPEALAKTRALVAQGDYASAHDAALALMTTPARQTSYQPVGDLVVEMLDVDDYRTSEYTRTLDLDTSVATVSFCERGRHTRRVIASIPHRVMAFTYESERPLDFVVTATSPQPQSSVTAFDRELVLTGRCGQQFGTSGAISFEARARIETSGTVEAGDGFVTVKRATNTTIFLSIASDHRSNPTSINLRRLERLTGDVFATSISAYQQQFRRCHLYLGPPHERHLAARLESFRRTGDPSTAALFFNFGRYLLIASSQPGTQAPNLQGIWNDDPRPNWGSKYTININLEMNYWPAESTGLTELVEPLIALVSELAETGAETAKRMYNARGWVCHHNTDLWRSTGPIDSPEYGLWPMGGAWLCIHLWDHYDFSRDTAYLESVYPLLVGACLFFIDTLQRTVDGWVVTNPSMSPENAHAPGLAICAGPTMDNQILRALFKRTIDAATILGCDVDLQGELSALRARLRPNEISQGTVAEWSVDSRLEAFDAEHRHVSHLWGLYPGDEINVDSNPDLAEACKRTLETRGDDGPGWSVAWKSSLWARLRNGKRAGDLFGRLLSRDLCFSNLFCAHPPLDESSLGCFQIDGNLGGAAAVIEMLVHTRGDEIRLLPACPPGWRSGEIRGVRVRGGWTVGFTWQDGRVLRVSAVSHVGGVCRIVGSDWYRTVTLEADTTVDLIL